jgi:hypothetical protein
MKIAIFVDGSDPGCRRYVYWHDYFKRRGFQGAGALGKLVGTAGISSATIAAGFSTSAAAASLSGRGEGR